MSELKLGKWTVMALDESHELAKKAQHFWNIGMVCNPFWYSVYCGGRAEVEYDESHITTYKIAMTFAQAYYNKKKIFYALRETLETWFKERRLPLEFITEGLKIRVLQTYERDGFKGIGLSEDFLELIF